MGACRGAGPAGTEAAGSAPACPCWMFRRNSSVAQWCWACQIRLGDQISSGEAAPSQGQGVRRWARSGDASTATPAPASPHQHRVLVEQTYTHDHAEKQPQPRPRPPGERQAAAGCRPSRTTARTRECRGSCPSAGRPERRPPPARRAAAQSRGRRAVRTRMIVSENGRQPREQRRQPQRDHAAAAELAHEPRHPRHEGRVIDVAGREVLAAFDKVHLVPVDPVPAEDRQMDEHQREPADQQRGVFPKAAPAGVHRRSLAEPGALDEHLCK